MPTTYKHQATPNKTLKLNELGVLIGKLHTALKKFLSTQKKFLVWNVFTASKN